MTLQILKGLIDQNPRPPAVRQRASRLIANGATFIRDYFLPHAATFQMGQIGDDQTLTLGVVSRNSITGGFEFTPEKVFLNQVHNLRLQDALNFLSHENLRPSIGYEAALIQLNDAKELLASNPELALKEYGFFNPNSKNGIELPLQTESAIALPRASAQGTGKAFVSRVLGGVIEWVHSPKADYEILFADDKKENLGLVYKNSKSANLISLSALEKMLEVNLSPSTFETAACITHIMDPNKLISIRDQKLRGEIQALKDVQTLLHMHPEDARSRFKVFDPSTRNGIPKAAKTAAARASTPGG